MLHPPYTAWHLAYVVIGSSLAPDPSLSTLAATLLAFFLAVGVAAHVLDERAGRPLGTNIPDRTLVAAAAVSLSCAVAIGAVGVARIGVVLIPFIAAGAVLVVGYNAEVFGGRLHSDFVFALGWGGFPLITAYVAQARAVSLGAVLVTAAAVALAAAQRALSTPARLVRRKVTDVSGAMVTKDGQSLVVDERMLLRPLEAALKMLSWSVVLLAAGLAVSRMG